MEAMIEPDLDARPVALAAAAAMGLQARPRCARPASRPERGGRLAPRRARSRPDCRAGGDHDDIDVGRSTTSRQSATAAAPICAASAPRAAVIEIADRRTHSVTAPRPRALAADQPASDDRRGASSVLPQSLPRSSGTMRRSV